ncbi:alpha-1A adrenergic receptor-like [Actinia tenebrosa]|uniref:Alpha-1A adrenergic receptor-like n=1 Tax=Actinia tenebrosa TaxID=6105 RepID=A0A6P8HWM7_ACTTE|nr:alpha-1A adrenergic receptor-like [Actinia tenebrosa]
MMNMSDNYSWSAHVNTTLNTSLEYNDVRCEVHPTAKNLALAVILSLICTMTFVGNAGIILTVATFRSLHSVTYFLLVSLALADILVSMFSMPFRIHQTLRNGQWCLNLSACAFWIWTDSFACCASITNLAAIGVERFLAIKAPLRYRSLMDQKTGLKLMGFIWLYALIWASLGNLNWSNPHLDVFNTNRGCGKYDPLYYTVVATLAFFLPLAVVIVAYTYLTRVALFHARALQNLVSPEYSRMRGGSSVQSDRTLRLIREIKATKMMAVVVGAFFICWFPFFVVLLKNLWSPSPPVHPVLAEFIRVLVVIILPNLNSALNPLIYMKFTRELRKAFLRLVNQLFHPFCCAKHHRRKQECEEKGNSTIMKPRGQNKSEVTGKI